MKKLFLTAMCLFMLAGYAIAGEKENLEKEFNNLQTMKVYHEQKVQAIVLRMEEVGKQFKTLVAAEKKAESNTVPIKVEEPTSEQPAH